MLWSFALDLEETRVALMITGDRKLNVRSRGQLTAALSACNLHLELPVPVPHFALRVLSERQTQVAVLVAIGKSNGEFDVAFELRSRIVATQVAIGAGA
jgi:DNA-binding CsgD family transcriptional regulator